MSVPTKGDDPKSNAALTEPCADDVRRGAGLASLRRVARLGSQGGWAGADQALFAGSNLVVNVLTSLLPQFVRSRRVAGRFPRLVFATAAAFTLEAACYWLMLVFLGERLVTLLYGATFHFDRSALLLIGAIPPLTSLVNILGNALRAREEPEGVFWATIAAVAVAATAGVASVARLGVNGAIVGMVCSGTVQVGVMLWLLSRDPAPASVVVSASEPAIIRDALA